MKTIFLSFVLAIGLAAQQPVQRVLICTDAGTTDAYACTAAPTLAAYTTGLRVRLYPATVNTGAATLAIDALAATTIKKPAGGITTDLADNDIRAGQYVELIYDGTNFQMLSPTGNAASGGTDIGMILTFPPPSSGVGQGTTVYGMPYNWIVGAERDWYAPTGCTLSGLYVAIHAALTTSHTVTATVRTLVTGTMTDSAVTCVINDTSAPVNLRVCSDLTHSIAIAAGDKVSIKYVSDATSGSYFPAATLLCK